MNDLNDLIIADLKRDEGFRGDRYICPTGHPTIGYGTRLPLDEREATLLLEWRLAALQAHLASRLLYEKKIAFDALPDGVQRALTNMVYALGVSGLLGFRKMLRAVKAGDWDEAAKECLSSLYAQQVGGRAERNAALIRLGGMPETA